MWQLIKYSLPVMP